MKTVKFSECIVKETPHKIDVRSLYNHENAQVNIVTLKPGEGLKPHITPTEVVFYILEGTPDVMIGDERVTVEKDTLVESPSRIVHSLYNTGKSIARIMVIKAPRPVENSRVL